MQFLPPEALVLLNELGEANAWAAFFAGAPASFQREYRLEAHRVGSIWVTLIAGLDWTFFNRIVGVGAGAPASEAQLEDAIGILELAGCKNYMAQVSPLALPEMLPDWLAARGFQRSGNWAKMYRGNTPAASAASDLRVEAIGDEWADAFASVALAAFEMPAFLAPFIRGAIGRPGWMHYLGFDGDQAVAASAMYIAGEVGWLGFGCTLASHRRRGAQGAMFARRIEDGRARGCRWFVTETGEDLPDAPNPSFHNMLRSGFELAYQRPNYMHQAGETHS